MSTHRTSHHWHRPSHSWEDIVLVFLAMLVAFIIASFYYV